MTGVQTCALPISERSPNIRAILSLLATQFKLVQGRSPRCPRQEFKASHARLIGRFRHGLSVLRRPAHRRSSFSRKQGTLLPRAFSLACLGRVGSSTLSACKSNKFVRFEQRFSQVLLEASVQHAAIQGRRLTPPSSGRPKGRFAPFGPPLMSNVRPHCEQSARHRPCRGAFV